MGKTPKSLRDEYRYALLPFVRPQARVYTMVEACALLCVSRPTLQRMIEAGQLAGFKVPNTPGGHWKISENEIERYIKSREQDSRDLVAGGDSMKKT